MSKKLFVGNLPFSATDGMLQDAFGRFGTVESVKIVTDKETGKSRGFGFVEMSTEDEASAAMRELHGADFHGRNLSVSEARPPSPREGGGGGGYGGGGREGGGGGFRPRR